MKFLTIAVLALSFSAFADHHETMMKDMDKMPFDQHKMMMQEMLTKKSAMIQESKTCVDTAMDKAALKDCHMKMKDEKHAMMDEMHMKKDSMKKMK